jgi:hypothetical protein
MDLKWGKNGKRFRVGIEEFSKRKRQDLDVSMEELRGRAQILARIEREIMVYKQQVWEYSRGECCKGGSG